MARKKYVPQILGDKGVRWNFSSKVGTQCCNLKLGVMHIQAVVNPSREICIYVVFENDTVCKYVATLRPVRNDTDDERQMLEDTLRRFLDKLLLEVQRVKILLWRQIENSRDQFQKVKLQLLNPKDITEVDCRWRGEAEDLEISAWGKTADVAFVWHTPNVVWHAPRRYPKEPLREIFYWLLKFEQGIYAELTKAYLFYYEIGGDYEAAYEKDNKEKK